MSDEEKAASGDESKATPSAELSERPDQRAAVQQQQKPTLFDRLVGKIKDHPVGAAVLVGVAIVGFLGGPQKVAELVAEKEDTPPPVRVQYYSVSGHAISLLLVGKLDSQLSKVLGGKPIVWQNAVYDELRNLHNRFAQPLGNLALTTDDEELRRISDSLAFIAAAAFREIDERSINMENAVHTSLRDPLKGNGWKIAFAKETPKSELLAELKSGTLAASKLIFSKRLTCAEGLELLKGTDVADFYQHVTQAGCKDLSFDVVAQFRDLGCGDAGWHLSLRLPRLELRLAVVQNITGKAIKLNKLRLRAVRANGVEALPPALAAKTVDGAVGDGTLVPEERLVVPLGLRFENAPGPRQSASDVQSYSASEVGNILQSKSSMANRIDLVGVFQAEDESRAGGNPSDGQDPRFVRRSIGQIELTRIIDSYGFTPREAMEQHAYIGTVLTPEKIVVNGIERDVHTVNLGGLYISDHYEGGSCPYVYARLAGEQRQFLGEILIGRDSESKSGTNLKSLPSWPQEIILSEEEDETTFLRSARAICETQAGEQHVRLPGNGGALFSPGPHVIARGESVTLIFPPLDPQIRCETAFLEVSGYYIPRVPSPPRRVISRWFGTDDQ